MGEYPLYDPICVLLEIPFARWNDKDKQDFLRREKPMPNLDVKKTTKSRDRLFVRKFKMVWYSQYSWLCGSYYLKKLFCLPCLTISAKSSVWNTSGFADFGNVSRSLHTHEPSPEHIRSALRFKQLRSNISTNQSALQENSRLYIQQYNKKVQLNRRLMQLAIRASIYLGKQELACHDRNEYDHFKELLETLVSVSPVDIQEHYKEIEPVFTNNSKTIQNELFKCISEYMNEHLEREITKCDFFSVQVDASTDVRQKSLYSIIIRYVITGGILKERFLGFYDISSDQGVDILFNLIISCLAKYDYKSKLIGQCYDGATVMDGHLYDLQAKIKQEAPQAVFVPSLAHHLNLVLWQSCNSIPECRVFFTTVSNLSSFFQNYAKHTHIADTIKEERTPAALIARWTSSWKIFNVINNDWESLKQVISEIINGQSSDDILIRQSSDFLKYFNDFEFAMLVIIFHDIFTLTAELFDVLQMKSLDIDYWISHITQTQKLLDYKRNKATVMELFELALSRAAIPTDHDEGNTSVTLTQEKARARAFEKYKLLYYDVLDTVSMQITTRFLDINKIKFVKLMDTSKFGTFLETFPMDALRDLKMCYPDIYSEMKLQRLKTELQFIYANELYRDTEPQNFIKILSADSDIFKEAYKLFSLILTIPCTSVSMERGVSCLKRIKRYLRNTINSRITKDGFENLARISIEKELLNELIDTQPFYEDIINMVADLEDRKIDLTIKK